MRQSTSKTIFQQKYLSDPFHLVKATSLQDNSFIITLSDLNSLYKHHLLVTLTQFFNKIFKINYWNNSLLPARSRQWHTSNSIKSKVQVYSYQASNIGLVPNNVTSTIIVFLHGCYAVNFSLCDLSDSNSHKPVILYHNCIAMSEPVLLQRSKLHLSYTSTSWISWTYHI